MLIFITEDDFSLRNSLMRSLIKLGHQVEVFSSAEQLLDALQDIKTNEIIKDFCILLDFDLPGMNGIECLIRINQINQSIPTIFMSGAADSASIIESWRNGAKNFILKPFKIDELISAIDKAGSENMLNPDPADLTYISQYQSLTPREKQVLKLVATGKTNPIIAEILSLTVRTVKMHRGNIMHKLDFEHVSELVRFYDNCRDLFDEI